MLQAIITVLMAAGSLLLLAYWFRYTCLLILTAQTSQAYAREMAAAYGLSFSETQGILRSGDPGKLDELQASLDRDFALLSCLKAKDSGSSIEDRMLRMNYEAARFRCRIAASFSRKVARQSLEEMSDVIAHMASSLGEKSAVASA